jgi:hypothetical protein
MLEIFLEKIMSKKEDNNSVENVKNVENDECKNNNTGWILFYLIWFMIALWAVYLSYKCNQNLPKLQRIGHAFLAFIFSIFYIIYIFFFTNCYQIKAGVPSATPSLARTDTVTTTSQMLSKIPAPAPVTAPVQAQSLPLASTIIKK